MTEGKPASPNTKRRTAGSSPELVSAILLLVVTAIAIVWTNSPFGSTYEEVWSTILAINLGPWQFAITLEHVVSDGLMAIFFFTVGLEVKRELSVGELTEKSRAIVPVAAAIAGLIVPAGIFLLLNAGTLAAHAWGAVISTDTAFLVGALILIRPQHPARLRIFILTLAVVDDIGALIVIALFYSDDLEAVPLLVAFVLLILVFLTRFLPPSVRGALYAMLGLGVWVCFDSAGVHPTLAGVAIALIIPVVTPRRADVEQVVERTRSFRQSPSSDYAVEVKRALRQSISINDRLQTAFRPWTGFVVLPLFALANAGVRLDAQTLSDAMTSRLTWGIVAGLVIGKLVGIVFVTAVLDRTGTGKLAPGLGLSRVAGGAMLCGIGFTISLLIVGIAIEDPELQNQARVGVLLASVLAFGLGWLLLSGLDHFRPTHPVGAKLNRPFDPERDHFVGPTDAPLTLVEYGDFECPFCARATGTIDEVREHFGDELLWVWRHFPLTAVHPHAQLAALAGEAASRQGKMLEYSALLFENQDRLDHNSLLSYAQRLGLNIDRFELDLNSPKIERRVQDDAEDVYELDLSGTPTFFVNGKRHHGPWDSKSLIASLEENQTRDAQQ